MHDVRMDAWMRLITGPVSTRAERRAQARLRSTRSTRGPLLIAALCGCVSLSVKAQQPVAAPGIERITLNSAGAQSSGDQAIISADGRFVLFKSSTSNLDGLGGVSPQRRQWFLRDRQNARTELISRNAAGQPATFGPQASFQNVSIHADVSADGRYVVLDSQAINLVPGVAGENRFRSYLRDRVSGTIELISDVPADPNRGASTPTIDDAGRAVFFSCRRAFPDGPDRLCRLDTATRNVAVVFEGIDPNSPIHVSALGNRVVFYRDVSSEPGACAPATLCAVQPFVLDLATQELISLTRTSDGGYSNKQIFNVALNADGSVAALSTMTGTFFSDPRLPDSAGVVLVRYLDTGRTILASRLESGEPPLCGFICSAYAPSISGDGNLVAFVTNAFNFPGGNPQNVPQAFVYDIRNNRLELASRNAANVPGDYGAANNLQFVPNPPIEFYDTEISPRLSTDGRFVAFHSQSTNLITTPPPNGYPAATQTYVRRLSIGQGPAVAVPGLSIGALGVLVLALLAMARWHWARRAAPG
jgi:hypothetical protein